jgi:WD40 repeat protein
LRWDAQSDTISRIIFSSDGKTLMSCGDGAIHLWDPVSGAAKSTTPTPASLAARSPDGRILTCTGYRPVRKAPGDYWLECYDLTSGARLTGIDHYVYAIAFSSDSKFLATATRPLNGGGSSTIELWSLPAFTKVATWPRPGIVTDLAFSPDGKTLASGEGATIELLNVATRASTKTLSGPRRGWVGSIRFMPDGQTLIALHRADPGNDATLWRWDVAAGSGAASGTGAIGRCVIQFDHPLSAATYSDDVSTLGVCMTWYTFGRSDRVEVWNLKTFHKIDTINKHGNFICSVAVSPDGSQLAVGYQPAHYRSPAPIEVWHVRR